MPADSTEIWAILVLLITGVIILIIAIPLLIRTIKEFKNYGQVALIIMAMVALAWAFVEIFKSWRK